MLLDAIAVLYLKRLIPKEYNIGITEKMNRNNTDGPMKQIAALLFSLFSFLTRSPCPFCFLHDVILLYCYIN